MSYDPETFRLHRYALTKEGDVINVDSYCLRLTEKRSTYVFLIQDMDIDRRVAEAHINWNTNFNELSL